MQVLKASGTLDRLHPLFAPYLKRRTRSNGTEARYFVVPEKDIEAGYPVKTIPIPSSATEIETADLCQAYWKEVLAWREVNAPKRHGRTLGWLVERYLNDDFSPFRKLREKTRVSYAGNCKIIMGSQGHIALSAITGPDILRWHHEWGHPVPVLGANRKPLKDPWGNAVTEASAPQRARHVIVMLRILAKHAVLIGAPNCVVLRNLLSEMEFPVPRARDVAPTRAQVDAIVKTAKEQGYLSIAITTLAQFELIERRVHIIGYWESGQWRPGWVWQNIDHAGPNATWRIRYFQTKVGVVLRDFDLATTPELLAMLQSIPEERRVGPVIIAERQKRKSNRLPWHERHYAEVFRRIATAAGLPDTITSMDMRAGGATEADSTPGISDRALQDAGGWNDPKTPQRYRRNKQRNAGEVVRLRQKSRTPGNE